MRVSSAPQRCAVQMSARHAENALAGRVSSPRAVKACAAGDGVEMGRIAQLQRAVWCGEALYRRLLWKFAWTIFWQLCTFCRTLSSGWPMCLLKELDPRSRNRLPHASTAASASDGRRMPACGSSVLLEVDAVSMLPPTPSTIAWHVHRHTGRLALDFLNSNHSGFGCWPDS